MICRAETRREATVEDFDFAFMERYQLFMSMLYRKGFTSRDERMDIIHTFYADSRDSLVAFYNNRGDKNRPLVELLVGTFKKYAGQSIWRRIQDRLWACDPEILMNDPLFSCTDSVRESCEKTNELIAEVLSVAENPDIIRWFFLDGLAWWEIASRKGCGRNKARKLLYADMQAIFAHFGIQDTGQWKHDHERRVDKSSRCCRTPESIAKKREHEESKKRRRLTCETCGKQYTTYRKVSKNQCCSPECVKEKDRLARARACRCEICGKPFSPDGGQRRFCSPECILEKRSRQHFERLAGCGPKPTRPPSHEKPLYPCRTCGKEIQVQNGFCSTACANEFIRERERRKVEKVKASQKRLVCAQCGEVFFRENEIKVCSAACWTAFYRLPDPTAGVGKCLQDAAY